MIPIYNPMFVFKMALLSIILTVAHLGRVDLSEGALCIPKNEWGMPPRGPGSSQPPQQTPLSLPGSLV